jgi:hypothetical protein
MKRWQIAGLIALAVGWTLEARGETWIDKLPAATRASILWRADHEGGNLYQWHYADNWPTKNPNAGGGVFNTGGSAVTAQASGVQAHSGQFSAQATITGAYQETTRAVRLMRWTDKPWDAQPQGGTYFPNEAYYSAWFYFPHVYNPTQSGSWDTNHDGGWWNIFQFKSDDAQGDSQPIWVLNVDHDAASETMRLYLYSKYNAPHSFTQSDPLTLPAGQWVHIEAYYKNRADQTGQIIIWQDGREIIHVTNVRTSLGGSDGNVIWGVGNYTDHITGGPTDGQATVYIDDAVVSTVATHTAVPEPGGLALLVLGSTLLLRRPGRAGTLS